MAFEYKNPTTGTQLSGAESIGRTVTFGNTFSVLNIGGYMEVWSLSDLVWTIDAQTKIDGGPVLYSGYITSNSISNLLLIIMVLR
jgi:hypothetical protein